MQPDAQPIYKLVFEQPQIQDPDLAYIPSLFTECLLADDGLSMTFKLRKGVTFHDSTALTAEDMSVGNEVPAWGQMVADARQDIYSAPWSLILPSGAIFLTLFAFNILGDGLRRSLDTRLTQTERS